MTDPLLSEPVPPEVAEQTVRAAEELAGELGATPEQVRTHVEGLPPRYLAAVSPRTVVRHTLLTASPPGAGEVRTRVTAHDEPGAEPATSGRSDDASSTGASDDPGTAAPDAMPADVLDVVALDRTGWFARVAGVIALHGGWIVAAEAFSRVDGLAIDTFRVRPPKGAGGSWWARVEGDLHDASSGRLAVRARVIRMARTDRERIRRRDRVPTSVRRVGDVGDTTIVEVRAVDRTGVLYSIASSLAELEIDIIGARVRTVGREAIDEFACRGPDGVLDDDRLAEAELAVVTSIDEL